MTQDALILSFAHGSADELATGAQLLTLLRRYDLSRWRFTSELRIERGVIPHSHPTLTLHTRHLDDDGLLLATYLHEQLHWFVGERLPGMEQAVAVLRQRYPQPPVGYPHGARDANSSYQHYVICWLERQALLDVVGATETERICAFWSHDHYTDIYTTVLADGDAIDEIVTHYVGLPPEQRASESEETL